jgi:CopG antitoxin of type II toxin-antitoxin system
MKKTEIRRSPKVSSISRAKTYEEIGAFWDTHDLTEFSGRTRTAAFDVDIARRRFLVAVDPAILKEVRKHATTRGLTPESLVNLWLKEKIAG